MRSQRRTTIIIAGGALAIASVGYGLGTQADDGTAVADSSQERNGGPPHLFFERGGPPPGFGELADTLGVEQDALQKAFRDFGERKHTVRHEELSTDLADALGISADKVSNALEALRDKHEGRLASRIADALGVKADDVKAALDKLKDDRPIPFHDVAAKLADELGVDEADVREALMDAGPGRGERHRDHALPLRQLAAELDVTRAELRKAFRELHPDGPRRGFSEHNQELAKFLADRFELDQDKVSDALADLPRPAPLPHAGRPGPGGPGAFGP